MRTKLLTSVAFIFLSALLFAQTSAPILKSSDVENFVKNFPSIKVELDALNLDIDPQDDIASALEGLDSYEDINSVVKKYGYNDYFDFAAKTSAIATAFASIKLKEGGAASEMQKAYDAIENDKSMTAEEKRMAKQQLDIIMAGIAGGVTTMVSEQDIAVVKPYVGEIEKLFDED